MAEDKKETKKQPEKKEEEKEGEDNLDSKEKEIKEEKISKESSTPSKKSPISTKKSVSMPTPTKKEELKEPNKTQDKPEKKPSKELTSTSKKSSIKEKLEKKLSKAKATKVTGEGKESEKTIILERIYNVPLRKEWLKAPKYRRAKKAVKALRKFLARHMKTEIEKVKISKWVNEEIWKHGIKNVPHKFRVKAIKYSDDIVSAEPLTLPKKAEKELEDKKKALMKKESKKGLMQRAKETLTGEGKKAEKEITKIEEEKKKREEEIKKQEKEMLRLQQQG